MSSNRVFGSSHAKGGIEPSLAKTALILIEFQNEFTTEGLLGFIFCAPKGPQSSRALCLNALMNFAYEALGKVEALKRLVIAIFAYPLGC